jgi:hypothetical protein
MGLLHGTSVADSLTPPHEGYKYGATSPEARR